MQRFICPECGIEAEIAPRYGDEVTSVYCLNHAAGADGHIHPVHMTAVPVTAPAVELEPVPA